MYSLLQLLYVLLHQFVQAIQPILVPLCFVLAWGILALGGWSVWAAARDGVKRARQMHRIPCAQCQYFSGNYLLKCPLHPYEALSEQAIDCQDFESTTLGWSVSNRLEES